MNDENAQFGKPSAIPADLRWRVLFKKDGEILASEPLEAHYIHVLTTLGKQPGLIGATFRFVKKTNRKNIEHSPALIANCPADL